MSNTFELAIVGLGPAGIGVSIALKESLQLNNVICFERGGNIGDAICSLLKNDECCQSSICHIVSGIGGASNLSSGKISYFPAGSGLVPFFDSEQQLKAIMTDVIQSLKAKTNLKRISIDQNVISEAEKHYDASDIQYKYYDVYEFDGCSYRGYLLTMMQSLINAGLHIRTNAEVLNIEYDASASCYIMDVAENGKTNKYRTKKIVLAVGSSELQDKLISPFTNKLNSDYEIGVRVEAKTEHFKNSFNSHGDLKLKYKFGRTYCVTKNGAIVSYRSSNLNFLEGYIDSNGRSIYSNLAILIKRDNERELIDTLHRYNEQHGGMPIKQRYVDFIADRASNASIYSSLANAKSGNINDLLSIPVNNSIREFISHVLSNTMGMDIENITLVAPELKLLRNIKISNTFEIQQGLYVVGAATGKFRGILQSLCSGIRCGQRILEEVN